MMRKHLLILLVLTVLIRGVMFISYPLGGQGESQGFYRYNVSQILAGDLQFGNLRYGPGYPLLIAPVAALGDLFGRFDDRIELLFQLVLSSVIPFLLYDILRSRHSPRAAFVVAILSSIDPFSLKWPHFYSSVWLVALCLVLALWLLHHAERRRSWRLVLAAGLVTGLGILARWNYAPLAVGLGCLLLFVGQEGFRRRAYHAAVFGVSAVLLVLLVHVTVQVPATGVWNFSCISGISLLEMTLNAGLSVDAGDGPNTKRLLHSLGLGQTTQLKATTPALAAWSSVAFPLFQTPGTWLAESERDVLFHQVMPENPPTGFQGDQYASKNSLLFTIGPCELDQLLRAVFFETVTAEPIAWLQGAATNAWKLLQPPLRIGESARFSLPSAGSLEYSDGSGLLGFQRAFGSEHHYAGQWVWRPGIAIFTLIWAPLNAIRFLVFPAFFWALFTRQRVYTVIAFLLLLYTLVLGAIDDPEHRIFAIVYPLGPVLIGGFLLVVWDKSRKLIA